MREKRRIAIITARGGSKRIPGKNIRSFCGKPIISYGIEAALASGIFDVVMVSTDSQDIAEIAIQYGAEVPFMRSEKTSSDFATTAEVIMEVLDTYKNMGQEFDYAACIYPTAPFITVDKLKNAMDLLEERNATVVMPVVRFSYPPQRGLIQDGDYIKMKWPQYRDSRSQDLEPLFHDCGQFYCYGVKKYMECSGKITEGIVPIEMLESQVQDIDTEEDWKMAELKYRLMTNML